MTNQADNYMDENSPYFKPDEENLFEDLSSMDFAYPDPNMDGPGYSLRLIRTSVGIADIEAWVKDNYPIEHCMHSRDCCGGWYRHFRPTIYPLAGMPYPTYLIVDCKIHNV